MFSHDLAVKPCSRQLLFVVKLSSMPTSSTSVFFRCAPTRAVSSIACTMTPPSIICAGLACLDMHLSSCAVPLSLESITPFASSSFHAGGSAPQTAIALSALSISSAAVYPAADDEHGRTLLALLTAAGVAARPVETGHATALAVLPVYTDGRRGCYVNLAGNGALGVSSIIDAARIGSALRGFHFGYPHLMAVRGRELERLFTAVRTTAPDVVLSLDVNGADVAEVAEGDGVLGGALGVVDLVHANLEEALVMSGGRIEEAKSAPRERVEEVVRWFLGRDGRGDGGVVVCVTCGKDGVFVGRGKAVVHRPAFGIGKGAKVNASGAGDSFTAGALIGVIEGQGKGWGKLDFGRSLEERLAVVADCGLASSLLCVDTDLRKSLVENNRGTDIERVLQVGAERPRILSRFASQPEAKKMLAKVLE